MRTRTLGILVAGGVAASALLAGMGQVEASKPFKPATRLTCEKCHTSKAEKEMSDKDLSACGKEALKALEGKGYKSGMITKLPEAKREAEATKWGGMLRGFKCP